MIGEYLESVKNEMGREFPSIDLWVVDDALMPRLSTCGVMRGVLEAETGDGQPDTTRTVDGKRILLLQCPTVLRLEMLLADADALDADLNPHQAMMTEGARVLNWLKDASFAYQSDSCEVVGLASELDLLNVGYSIVTARWNATVVADWPTAVVYPPINEVRLNVEGRQASISVEGRLDGQKVGVLDDDIDDAATALVLGPADASPDVAPDVAPATGDLLRINDERMTVVSYTSGTRSVTVTRASGGTTAAPHAQGDDVYLLGIDLTKRGVPLNLDLSTTDDMIVWAWDAFPRAVAYEYQSKRSSEANWGAIGTTTSPTVSLTGLTERTAYDFRVRTVTLDGRSDWRTASATTDPSS